MNERTLATSSPHLAIETAIEMEHLGGDFYQSLAFSGIDSKLADLCLKLAAAEAQHCEYFRQVQTKLAQQGRTVVLRDEDIAAARQAARKAIFPDQGAVGQLLRHSRMADLVDMAKRIEQSAIDHYTALAAALPQFDGLQIVIRAERSHLQMLHDYAA